MHLASDAFYSLFPCLGAGIFKELEIKIRNMKYRKGDLDGIEFSRTKPRSKICSDEEKGSSSKSNL